MMGFLEAAGLFRDSWRLYRKYYSQEKSKEMWNLLIEEAEGMYGKYRKQPFVREILVAVISEIERIDKRQSQI